MRTLKVTWCIFLAALTALGPAFAQNPPQIEVHYPEDDFLYKQMLGELRAGLAAIEPGFGNIPILPHDSASPAVVVRFVRRNGTAQPVSLVFRRTDGYIIGWIVGTQFFRLKRGDNDPTIDLPGYTVVEVGFGTRYETLIGGVLNFEVQPGAIDSAFSVLQEAPNIRDLNATPFRAAIGALGITIAEGTRFHGMAGLVASVLRTRVPERITQAYYILIDGWRKISNFYQNEIRGVNLEPLGLVGRGVGERLEITLANEVEECLAVQKYCKPGNSSKSTAALLRDIDDCPALVNFGKNSYGRDVLIQSTLGPMNDPVAPAAIFYGTVAGGAVLLSLLIEWYRSQPNRTAISPNIPPQPSRALFQQICPGPQ